jgi:CRISPR/Cas system endoribonuclease Cas6 (RAMP superfamily)
VLQNGQRLLIGGVGKMTFRAIHTDQIADDWWQAITTLAAFAPYCGTGHKTAQGMGVTAVHLLRSA